MPIICHLKSENVPIPFKWVGEGIVKHRRRPTELYYPSFIHGDLKVEKGDFVLVRNDESMDPEDSSNCFVARVDDLFETDDEEAPHKAKVQWFSRMFEVPPQHIRNLPNIDYSRELVEDHRSEFSNVIDAESIFSVKCVVITIQENLKTKPPANPHMSVYYCRYKFTGATIVPKIPKDTECEIRTPQNKGSNVSSPSHIDQGNRKSSRKSKSETLKKRASSRGQRKEQPLITQDLKDSDLVLSNGLKSLSIRLSRIDSLLNGSDFVNCQNIGETETNSISGKEKLSKSLSKSSKLLRTIKKETSDEEVVESKSSLRQKSHHLKSILKDRALAKSEISTLSLTPCERSCRSPNSTNSASEVKSVRRSSRRSLFIKEEIETCVTTPPKKAKLRNSAKNGWSPLSEKKKTAKKSLNFATKQDNGEDPVTTTTTRYGRKVKSVSNFLGSDIDSLLSSPKKQKNTPKKTQSSPRRRAKFYHSDASDDESTYAPSAGSSSDENGVFSDSEDFIKTRKTPLARKNILRTPQSKKKSRTPITPTIPGRQQPVGTPQSLLEESRQRLHVSAVPDSLPCREEEFSDIFSFIRSNLLHSSGGCMYVSGVPGTGKTATVHEVVKRLERERELNRLPSFQFVEVNGMKMTDPYQCYVQIFQKLTGERIAPQQAANLLDKRFTQPGPKKEAVVLLVDELDKLWTRKQTVMYNIFDWPGKPCSKLIVIAIANTMDLPEKIMLNRISSRLGLTRKTFHPYSFQQLQEIVMSRIRELQVFNPDAVQLVARKVAALSGDARRALEICRRAAEIAGDGSVVLSPSKRRRTLVEMAHVDAALNQMFSSPVVTAIGGCSELQKAFLKAILAEFERTGTEETSLLKSYRQLVTLCRFEGLHPPTTSDMSALCIHLASSNLVIVDDVQNDLYMKIRLNVSMDDVNYALTGRMT